MKLNDFITESFQTVSINGILRSLNTDERKIYEKVKSSTKLPKSDLGEYDLRIANEMVTKGLLQRRKNPQHEIYFIAKGRRKNGYKRPDDLIAPPDKDMQKWIQDNEQKYQEKFGDNYRKQLYDKAWNKFNGKKLSENIDLNLLKSVSEAVIPSRKCDKSKFKKGDYVVSLDGNTTYLIDDVMDDNKGWCDYLYVVSLPMKDGSSRMSWKFTDKQLESKFKLANEQDDALPDDYWDGED